MHNWEYNKYYDGLSHYFVAYSSRGIGIHNYIDRIHTFRKYLGPGMCVMTFTTLEEAQQFALVQLRHAMPPAMPMPTAESLTLGSLKTYNILYREMEKAGRLPVTNPAKKP